MRNRKNQIPKIKSKIGKKNKLKSFQLKKNRKKKKKKHIFGTFRYNNSHCPFSLEANNSTRIVGSSEFV